MLNSSPSAGKHFIPGAFSPGLGYSLENTSRWYKSRFGKPRQKETKFEASLGYIQSQTIFKKIWKVLAMKLMVIVTEQ